MKQNVNRRDFIIKSSKTCLTGCLLVASGKLATMANFYDPEKDEIPDPKKLNYCGYQCPDDCKFLKASVENNAELKKEAYDLWKIKERYNVDFDPDKIFCYGCKNPDKTAGVVLANCSVRSCAIEKEYDCCIECDELQDCEKELWTRFPEFHKMVIDMQNKYFEAQTSG